MGLSGWDHMGGGVGGMGWGVGGILMLLVVAAAIWVIVSLTKGASGPVSGSDSPREKSALDVLKERYARGDSGREEFEQKKRDLQ